MGRENRASRIGYEWQSFVEMLVEDSPHAGPRKAQDLGSGRLRSIFARAIGLNSVFADPPIGGR